jgi:hypothetical protein
MSANIDRPLQAFSGAVAAITFTALTELISNSIQDSVRIAGVCLLAYAAPISTYFFFRDVESTAKKSTFRFISFILYLSAPLSLTSAIALLCYSVAWPIGAAFFVSLVICLLHFRRK